jgi:putative salt-induced outer membrane protein YdiY
LPVPTVLHSSPVGLQRWHGVPLNPAFQDRFDIHGVLSLTMEGEGVKGRLFAPDKKGMTSDDLVLGRIVANQLATQIDYSNMLRQLQRSAAVEERVRMARDLHDGLLQSLTGAALQLETANRLMEADPPTARQRLLEIQRLIAAEQKELRSYVEEMTSSPLSRTSTDSDLATRLKELAERVERHWSIRVEMELRNLPPGIPHPLVKEIYFLVHESLINAARHANASSVRAELGVEAERANQAPGKLLLTTDAIFSIFDRGRKQGRPMKSAVIPLLRILLLVLVSSTVAPDWGTADDAEPPPDEVTARGTTLKGRVLDLEANGIHFRTIYGKGEIFIRYEEIEHITTQGEIYIYHSDGRKIKGRLVGKEGESLLVGTESETAFRLNHGSIVRGVPAAAYERSWIDRLRTEYPWWKISLDAGWEFERTAVDKNNIFLGFNAERRKSPTRFIADFRYAFETQKTTSEPKSTTTNEMRAFLRGEYDFTPPWFLFFEPAAEWDRPRGIDIRAYPGAGLGYRFVETKTALLQLLLGPGYVYEEFTDLGSNEYAAVYFGLDARYAFRSYFITLLRLQYMPGIQDIDENWLFRAELEFSIPITQVLAMKLRFTQVNDNNPSPDVGNNKFTSNLLLSFGF